MGGGFFSFYMDDDWVGNQHFNPLSFHKSDRVVTLFLYQNTTWYHTHICIGVLI